MRRKAAVSAIHLFRTGFSSKPHNLNTEKRRFPSKPRIDFTSVGQINDAIRLFREMVVMSPQPSVLAYNKLLSVIAKMEEYAVALYVFDEMRHSSFPMNEFTMTIVINCCCHLNRVDLGFAVMGSFLKHNYLPDVTTFSALLRGLFWVGNVAEAQSLFEKVLFFRQCLPDDFMILTMVDGLCKSGQTLKARNLLWDLERTGYKPGVYSYNALIDGLCKDGMVDDALQLLSEMPYKGIGSNVVTYTTIIDGLCKGGRIDDALNLLSEMSDKGIRPNVITYNTIINGYAQHGFMTEALQVFNSMLMNGIKPNGVTFLAVLSSCAHVGALEEALYHFGSMTKDFGITPGLDHLACLVTLYARKGETKAAYDLVRNFPCAPNKTVWTCILSGCVMNKDLDLARLAAKEIISMDPNEAIAYVMLSNLYASLNMWEEASKVKELMKEKKVKREIQCSWIRCTLD